MFLLLKAKASQGKKQPNISFTLAPCSVDWWNRRCSFKLVIEEGHGIDKCKLFSSVPVHDSVFISNIRIAEFLIAEFPS